MEKGDHLIAVRWGREHHGLYAGEGRVIRLAALRPGEDGARVELTSLPLFLDGGKLRVQYPTCRTHGPEESVARAFSLLGTPRGAPCFDDSEQFVNWCVFGVRHAGRSAGSPGFVSVPVPVKYQKRLSLSGPLTRRLALVHGCCPSISNLPPSLAAGLAAGIGAWLTAVVIAGGVLPGGFAATDLYCSLLTPPALGVAVGCAVKWFWDWL